jgi:hypothetical protein
MSDSDDTKALEAAMQGKSLSPFVTTKNKKKPLIQRICEKFGRICGRIRRSVKSFLGYGELEKNKSILDLLAGGDVVDHATLTEWMGVDRTTMKKDYHATLHELKTKGLIVVVVGDGSTLLSDESKADE